MQPREIEGQAEPAVVAQREPDLLDNLTGRRQFDVQKRHSDALFAVQLSKR
jgi:hypothetical protein